MLFEPLAPRTNVALHAHPNPTNIIARHFPRPPTPPGRVPPIAQENIRLQRDDLARLQLKRPFSDGTFALKVKKPPSNQSQIRWTK
jgi:hypothetical protein